MEWQKKKKKKELDPTRDEYSNEEHLAKISFLNKIKDDLEQEQGSSLATIEWWEKKNESLTSSEQRWDDF